MNTKNTKPSLLKNLIPVAGVRLSSAESGLKYQGRDDVVLIEIAQGASVACVFTQNAFCAAPVTVAKSHLTESEPRYLLINAGNANAGTGRHGLEAALQCCRAVSQHVSQCDVTQVLPFSTGVIGEDLCYEKICNQIPVLVEKLSAENWSAAAKAILTTDLQAKGLSLQAQIGEETVTVTGIIKGSGMIRPNMATLLAYIASDVGMESSLLQTCLNDAVRTTLNRITVDSDTSTNDACVLIATGQSNVRIRSKDSLGYQQFSALLKELCLYLAHTVVRDAEGATKFISIEVNGGTSEKECEEVAYTIAHSLLVKTALFASDPNWGRILAAVGRAGVEGLDVNAVEIYLDDLCIVRQGARASEYSEEMGQAVMKQSDIKIEVRLARGDHRACVWTSDLSYDYIKINAEYRS